ncbi:hypothetical protein [Gramella sp. AN32]|uniref:Dehydrin n=1 Tax=Christiangramia antarctica TaxID=2058158 RepID=A0ABW5X6M9_9FLAO|nr:hypothetical protein [Gramella sp. AN32]
MKTPNYDDKQGKHPIPHAKGITKDEKEKDKIKKDDSAKNTKKEQK